MSFFVKQSNSWFLFLAIVVVAVIGHWQSPVRFFTSSQPTSVPQSAAARTDVQRANLEGVVSGAIGIDQHRGDHVSVIILNSDR